VRTLLLTAIITAGCVTEPRVDNSIPVGHPYQFGSLWGDSNEAICSGLARSSCAPSGLACLSLVHYTCCHGETCHGETYFPSRAAWTGAWEACAIALDQGDPTPCRGLVP
jgi:hypothetical protein